MQKFKNASPTTKLVIGIAMALLSIGFFIGLGNIFINSYEVSQWPTVTGTIVKSELQKERRDGSGGGGFITGKSVNNFSYVYCPSVTYTYVVNNHEYTNTDIDPFGSKTCYSEYTAPDIKHQYPEGSHPQVYYHPRRPFKSALETQVSWKLLGELALFAFGFGIFAFIVIRSGYYGKKFEKIAAERLAQEEKIRQERINTQKSSEAGTKPDLAEQNSELAKSPLKSPSEPQTPSPVPVFRPIIPAQETAAITVQNSETGQFVTSSPAQKQTKPEFSEKDSDNDELSFGINYQYVMKPSGSQGNVNRIVLYSNSDNNV